MSVLTMDSCQLNSPRSPVSTAKIRQRRITQACDFCHRRGVKCREAASRPVDGQESSCLTCLEYGESCTRSRRPKKRGTKSRRSLDSETGSGNGHSRTDPLTASLGRPFETIDLAMIDGNSSPSNLRSRKVITALLDVYLDTIHPTWVAFVYVNSAQVH